MVYTAYSPGSSCPAAGTRRPFSDPASGGGHPVAPAIAAAADYCYDYDDEVGTAQGMAGRPVALCPRRAREGVGK
jgi:hypothetical protein